MKKKLVDYDSDDDSIADYKEIPIKKLVKKDNSNNDKKKIKYSNLPINQPINFNINDEEENWKPISLDDISNDKDNKNEILSINTGKSFLNLSKPKNTFERREKNFLKYDNSEFISKKVQNNEEERQFSSQNGDDYNIDKNSIDEDKNLIKNIDLIKNFKLREKNLDKDFSIVEVNNNDLLNFDWKGNLQKEKVKKELNSHFNIAKPSKTQKNKHQLVYLAYDALSRTDEIEDRISQQIHKQKRRKQNYAW